MIKKQKVLSCSICKKNTVHTLVDYNTVGQELPMPMRGLLFISSIGLSEMKTDKKYQCECCKHIITKI